MKISKTVYDILFNLVVSIIMSFVMSIVMTIVNLGMGHPAFLAAFFQSLGISILVSFSVIYVTIPLVARWFHKLFVVA
jgi:hypothetical protein